MGEDESGAGEKPQLPQVLKELGEQALARHMKRQATPMLKVTVDQGQWSFASPYRDEDEDYWVALLFDAFATRSQATFRTFTSQLAALCSTTWNDSSGTWHPQEDELVAAIQIVRSTKPRNEAEACLAAQMVAVHVMQMKLSAEVAKRSWAEPRTCAIAGKLARTYAMQLETMAKLKGKGSRQRITVRKYSQHEHKHIHLHQGGSGNGNQPHGPRKTRSTQIKPPDKPAELSSLLGSDPAEDSLPKPGRARAASMSAARRSRRFRGSEG